MSVQEYKSKTLVVGGGFATNIELRKYLKSKIQMINNQPNPKRQTQIRIAPPNLCTDNGLMIALAGYFRWRKKQFTKNLSSIGAQPNLRLQ